MLKLMLPLVLLMGALSQHPNLTPNPAQKDNPFCSEAMSLYWPEEQVKPAPNITLTHLQIMSPDGACGGELALQQIDQTELRKLNAALKPIAAAAFADSRSNLGVMVRYILTTNQPAQFDMMVTEGAPEHEMARLQGFYNKAQTLKNFQSQKGTVHVAFQYTVVPKTP